MVSVVTVYKDLSKICFVSHMKLELFLQSWVHLRKADLGEKVHLGENFSVKEFLCYKFWYI